MIFVPALPLTGIIFPYLLALTTINLYIKTEMKCHFHCDAILDPSKVI